MKRYLSILSILIMLTIGIVNAATDTTGTTNMSKTNGSVLYTYITKESNYKMWQMWPGKGEFYPGKQPHGALLTTYVTNNVIPAVEAKAGVLPDESIIVKENYMSDKTLVALTVMYKESGYDPEHNDWFWARYAPNGTVLAEGKIKDCIDCHIQPKAEFGNQINDYIFTSNLQVIETPTIAESTVVPTVKKTEMPIPSPVPTESPGFEGIIGIVVLVLVIYLFRNRKE